MNRNNKILRHINKDGHGIEIGPSHDPIAPKKKGYNVHIIDHLSRKKLIDKYTDHDVNLENIEEVDFIWQGQSYAELTGESRHYDWIIASHMIEHTPDFIGFLNDCDTILKDDGVISLVIPDKRYCFDYYRPVTGISKIIDSHLEKSKHHTPGTVAEYFLNVASKDGNVTWNKGAPRKCDLIHSLEYSSQQMKLAQNKNDYLDVHAWCFVPHSFRLIIHDLFSLGLIPFQEIEFFNTKRYEFFITLSRKGNGLDRSRQEMLDIIQSEIKKEATILERLVAKCKGIVKKLIFKKFLSARR